MGLDASPLAGAIGVGTKPAAWRLGTLQTGSIAIAIATAG